MIADELLYINRYTAVCPSLQKVVDFMAEHDLSTMADGRYPLDVEGECFVNIQTVPAKDRDAARLESHRNMVDVQIPLTGDEVMGYRALSYVEGAPYDAQNDIAFHPGCADSFVTIKKGMFAIFFPQDVHAPGIVPVAVKKAVFKIPVQK